MKLIIVLAAIIALAVSIPVPADSDTVLLKSEVDHVDPTGYKFEYEQSDGVSRSEEGVVKNIGTDEEAIEVRGIITWTAPDGQEYSLSFIADENGYRPQGAHLPTV